MAPVPAVPAALPLTRPQLGQRSEFATPRPRRPPQPPLRASNKYPKSALPAAGDNCICFPDELENVERWGLPREPGMSSSGLGPPCCPHIPPSLSCSMGIPGWIWVQSCQERL